MSHPHQTRSSSRKRLLNGEDNPLNFDVIQSGPTRTTSTLTPTTLRNIEQTLQDQDHHSIESSSAQHQIPHQAGFVPPMAPFPFHHQQQQQQQQQVQQSQQPQQQHVLDLYNNSNSLMGDEDDDDDQLVNQSMGGGGAGLDDDNSMDSDSMSNGSWPSQHTATTSTPPPPGSLNSSKASSSAAEPSSTKRNKGGRRPNKPSNLSPEEEEKRKLRRERNKLAAARCRKRRVDHTNELTTEVDGLEKKKQNLQNDIKSLQQQKEELEFLLEAHRDHCRLYGRASSPLDVKPTIQQQFIALADKIKSEPLEFDAPTPPTMANTDSSSTSSPTRLTSSSMLLHNNPLMSSVLKNHTPTSDSAQNPMMGVMLKPRPTSLAVPLTLTPSQSLAGVRASDFSGIPISTPSTGIFNFESLMDGGTGLTPVAGPLVPTSTGAMAQHQRNPLEFPTPTSEPSKLVSL